MTPETQSELAELEALNNRLQQEVQRLNQELTARKAASCALFAVEDPASPNTVHLIRGTLEGIQALQGMLRQRFDDGRALGKAEASDLIEALQASLQVAG
jgi:hypothetical protein